MTEKEHFKRLIKKTYLYFIFRVFFKNPEMGIMTLTDNIYLLFLNKKCLLEFIKIK